LSYGCICSVAFTKPASHALAFLRSGH